MVANAVINGSKGGKTKKSVKTEFYMPPVENYTFYFGISDISFPNDVCQDLGFGLTIRKPNEKEKSLISGHDIDPKERCQYVIAYDLRKDMKLFELLGSPIDVPIHWCDFLEFALLFALSNRLEKAKDPVEALINWSSRPHIAYRASDMIDTGGDPTFYAGPPPVDNSGRLGIFFFKQQNILHGEQYELENIVSLKKAISDSFELFGNERMRAACERYLWSRLPISWNRVLDSAFALEALVGDNQPSSGSISYKLAMRTAVLISTDVGERKEMSTLIKHIYSYRSELVHGSISKSKKWLLRNHPNYLVEFSDIIEHLLKIIIEKKRYDLATLADEKLLGDK